MNRFFAYTFLFVALCLTPCARTDAALSLTLDDGVNPVVIVFDNGLGDTNLTVGKISFDNTNALAMIPGFQTLEINSTSNAPGLGIGALLNTTTIETTTAVAKSLSVTVLDTFSLPGAAGDVLNVSNKLTGNHGLGGSASASQISSLDAGSTSAATVGISSANGVQTDVTTANLLRAGATFLLETQLSTSIDSNTSVNFGSTTSAMAIPEPATIAVWSALGTIGFLAYRRRQLA